MSNSEKNIIESSAEVEYVLSLDYDNDNFANKTNVSEINLEQKICDDTFTLNVLSKENDEKLERACQYFRENFDNFIFEGGGIRGIAFGGALKFADDHDLIKNIIRFAGSSAGSIVAAGLAVGYSGSEIIQILHKTNFEDFKDDDKFVIFDVYRFINEYGVYKGEKFLEWIGNIFKTKTGNADITFKEVYERYGKELVVTGTNVNRYMTRYFHHRKDPNMPVRLAVRISMSIPVFFKAVKLTEYECSFCYNMMPDNTKTCYDCGRDNYYTCKGAMPPLNPRPSTTKSESNKNQQAHQHGHISPDGNGSVKPNIGENTKADIQKKVQENNGENNQAEPVGIPGEGEEAQLPSCGEHIMSGYGICPSCKYKNIFHCLKCGEPLIKEMEDGTIKKSRIDRECWNCRFCLIPKVCENVYVDGGLLNNYPIWVFDGQYIGDNQYTEEEISKSRSLGFKLMTDQEKKDYRLYHSDAAAISGIIDFFTCLINSMSIQIERGHIRTGYWDKTVTISTHNVNWLEFNLPLETKEKLIQQGYDALHEKLKDMGEMLNEN